MNMLKTIKIKKKKPSIIPELIPRLLWSKSIKQIVSEKEWSLVKKYVDKKCKRKCVFCKSKHNIRTEAQYDYETDFNKSELTFGTQILTNIYTVCELCYYTRHPGNSQRASIPENEIIDNMTRILHINYKNALNKYDVAWTKWYAYNNVKKWKQDHSFLNKIYKYSIYDRLRRNI